MIVAPNVLLLSHCLVMEYFLSFYNCSPKEDNACCFNSFLAVCLLYLFFLLL